MMSAKQGKKNVNESKEDKEAKDAEEAKAVEDAKAAEEAKAAKDSKDVKETKEKKSMGRYVPTPRPGGFIKIKTDVKGKTDQKVTFDGFQNISSRVEDMEKAKYRVEKTVMKNPRAPTITPIRNLNLPKISQESLLDKCLVENEDNGETQGEYLRWLDETAPANDTNLMDNLEEAINFIVLLASSPDAPAKDFDEMQAISVVQFLRTVKTPSGQYEANNQRLMEYIDRKAEEFHKENKDAQKK